MTERHPSIDPVHPGQILREDILPALAMSKKAVAAALGEYRDRRCTTFSTSSSRSPPRWRFDSACLATAPGSGRTCNAAMTWQSKSARWTFPGYQPWRCASRQTCALADRHRLWLASPP